MVTMDNDEARLNQYIADQARDLAAAWSVSMPYEQTEIFANMSCGEATPLIALFSAVGAFDVAEGVMDAHATSDYEEDDEHHPLYLEHKRAERV